MDGQAHLTKPCDFERRLATVTGLGAARSEPGDWRAPGSIVDRSVVAVAPAYAPEIASPLEQDAPAQDVVGDLGVAESPAERAEVLVEVVVGARVAEVDLQEQPTGR